MKPAIAIGCYGKYSHVSVKSYQQFLESSDRLIYKGHRVILFKTGDNRVHRWIKDVLYLRNVLHTGLKI